METDEDREKIARAKAFARANAVRKRQKHGECLHPEAGLSTCRGGITAAHSIQKRGGLATIADVSNHVLTVIPTLATLIASEGRFTPRRIGINEASTFPGFCNGHDIIFSPIEAEELIMDDRAAFLFAYRSVCMEFFRKDNELVTARELEGDMNALEEPRRSSALRLLAAYRPAVEKALAEVQHLKVNYDEILLSGDLRRIRWLAVEFDGLLPIVTSASFFPEYEFTARPLQLLLSAKLIDSLSLNITAFDGRSWCIFTWLDTAGPAPQAFAESFITDVPDAQKANAAVCTAFEASENIFIDPAWWGQRSEFQRERLIERTASGTPAALRKADCFKNFGRQYSSVNVVRVERWVQQP